MSASPSPHAQSSAERRVLWEVRQRYNVDASPRRSGETGRPGGTPPRKPPRGGQPPLPPKRPVGKRGFGHARRGRAKRSWSRRIVVLVVLVLVLSGGVFGYKILAASNKITTTDRSILGQLSDLLFKQGSHLTGETEDRINLLLIAVGGEGHSGENLADTVMVLSYRPSDHSVGLLSIPRDLYVQVPDEQYFTKINAVHAYGESKKKGGGPDLLRREVEIITGQPMHYFVRVDFTAFKQIVDAVGGVNITIENSFFDYWHKIDFPASQELMNGERALAYVRARYIEGSEGGDFKRAARQQQVLLALRDKVFSVQTAIDFTAANAILNSLSDNIRTDLELWEMKRFFELARQIEHDKVKSVVLTTGPKGMLVGNTEVLSGVPASVLKTRTGDYSEIHSLAQNIFSTDQATAMPAAEATEETPTPSPEAEKEVSEEASAKPTIEVRNGTNTTGLAKQVATELEEKGYTVTSIGNAANRSVAVTTVYAVKDSTQDRVAPIADLLEAQGDIGIPEGEKASSADILVILGSDSD